MKKILFMILILLSSMQVQAKCVGKFFNPITGICWKCMFPLQIGPAVIGSKARHKSSLGSEPICMCKRDLIPKIGVPIGFWEAIKLADVTRTPFCMVNLGMQMGPKMSYKMGSHASGENGTQHSFYHVHMYNYPVFEMLKLFLDFPCKSKGSFDVGYLSELDPTWSDDDLANLFNPDVILYANPIADAACIVDCTKANKSLPDDKLHWCGGCQGSIYPLTGHIAHHISGPQASSLEVYKMLAKGHQIGSLLETTGKAAMCKPRYHHHLKKTQYRLQMTYPVVDKNSKVPCAPIGYSEESFNVENIGDAFNNLTKKPKEYPVKGEDFGYIIYRQVECCASIN